MKVLITGGSGFIGSYLAQKLLEENIEIKIFDNGYRGINFLECLGIHKIHNIDVISGDVRNQSQMESVLEDVDVVFHLAALSNVIGAISNIEYCYETNIIGTHNILQAALNKNVKKIVFSSSREIYGDVQKLPVNENHPLNPKNPYGISKLSAEKNCEYFKKFHDFDITILRIANVYGLHDKGRVIPIFIENCMNDKDLIVYGGNQVLDFIYISDVVDALVKSINVKTGVVNIGSGSGTSIIDLAKLIKKLTESESKIITKQTREIEVQSFVADISNAKRLLKWKPIIRLEDGLEKMIKYHS